MPARGKREHSDRTRAYSSRCRRAIHRSPLSPRRSPRPVAPTRVRERPLGFRARRQGLRKRAHEGCRCALRSDSVIRTIPPSSAAPGVIIRGVAARYIQVWTSRVRHGRSAHGGRAMRPLAARLFERATRRGQPTSIIASNARRSIDVVTFRFVRDCFSVKAKKLSSFEGFGGPCQGIENDLNRERVTLRSTRKFTSKRVLAAVIF